VLPARQPASSQGIVSQQAILRSAPGKLMLGALTGRSQLVLVGLLLGLCAALSIAAPQFASGANVIAILRQCALVLIVAAGMTLLLIAAEVDLSVGASIAFTGVVAMDVTNRSNSVTLGALAAIAFAGLVGVCNGLVVTRLKVNSLIATIATMMILQGSVFLYSREAVQNHNQLLAFTAIGAGYVGPLPIPVIIAAGIFMIAYMVLRRTTFGRYLYAVGANEKAARLSGLRSERLKLVAFTVTGLLVGVAGLILCSLMNAGQPTAGRGFELTVIAAVILGGTSLAGGRGTLAGTLLGVLVLKVIDNGIIILRWNQDLQMVVPGVVIILATWLDILRRRADAR
jgi:ribose transport system permease protein